MSDLSIQVRNPASDASALYAKFDEMAKIMDLELAKGDKADFNKLQALATRIISCTSRFFIRFDQHSTWERSEAILATVKKIQGTYDGILGYLLQAVSVALNIASATISFVAISYNPGTPGTDEYKGILHTRKNLSSAGSACSTASGAVGSNGVVGMLEKGNQSAQAGYQHAKQVLEQHLSELQSRRQQQNSQVADAASKDTSNERSRHEAAQAAN